MDTTLDAKLEEGEIHNLEARPGKILSPSIDLMYSFVLTLVTKTRSLNPMKRMT